MTPRQHTCGIGGRDCLACAWEAKLSRIPATQLSLWGAGTLSRCPEVRACAPLWPPESAASNATELERLVRIRRVQTEADCPWCGAQAIPVVYSRGGASPERLGALDDHQRPDGGRCRGADEALEQLAGRGAS